MFNIRGIDRASVCTLALLVIASASWGQPAPAAITAKFAPGTSVRYEFEGLVHISTERAPNVKWKAPADCSYQIKAVLKFDFTTASQEGTLEGRISFQGVEAQIPECAISSQERVSAAVKRLEASGAEFQVYATGDVRVTKIAGNDEPELVAILRKAAWDLLQPRLTDAELAPGSPSIASRRFLFWPDTFVEGLDVAAASMHYPRNVEIGSDNYALLEYKQVFSPADIPAYVDARTRARDFTGTTVVTGRSAVSLLWNRATQRVVYLHRQRTIDNRMMLKYDPADQQSAIARFLMQEESTLRWLPEKDSAPWLAALHRYEASASGEVPAIAKTQKPQIAETRELSELLDRAPAGFERWRKTYCNGVYCFDLSLAVPKGTQVADSTGMTTLLLGGSGDRTLMVSVGPMFDLQCACLTDEELLQQQTSRFVSTHLWFGRSTGEPLNFSAGSLHDRPAGFIDFISKSRDLTPIRGQLVMVIGQYDRLVPVACAHNEDQPDLDSACQTVTQSVIVE
jgi:hypothetical protein